MTEIAICIPKVGESIQEAYLSQWYKNSGDMVKKEEPILSIETDKISVEIKSAADGKLKIICQAGETVAIGTTVGVVDTEISASSPYTSRPEQASFTSSAVSPNVLVQNVPSNVKEQSSPMQTSISSQPQFISSQLPTMPSQPPMPSLDSLEKAEIRNIDDPVTLKPMSPIRQRIAQRLLEAKQNTAMLTTFNEVDMTRVQALRSQYKEPFQKKYGVSLGIMSFFVKATVEALKNLPLLNAFIEGKNIVYHHYYHIGVAIGSERGLVVPVLKNVDKMSFAEIEQSIKAYVKKIEDNSLELKDMEGGTFTVSNGGIFGSLCSTPILNMPQSGILGMHKIMDRPVAVQGQIVIKPMMYIALSYDHRIVDGRESVFFLNHVKDCIENPERIMLGI